MHFKNEILQTCPLQKRSHFSYKTTFSLQKDGLIRCVPFKRGHLSYKTTFSLQNKKGLLFNNFTTGIDKGCYRSYEIYSAIRPSAFTVYNINKKIKHICSLHNLHTSITTVREDKVIFVVDVTIK